MPVYRYSTVFLYSVIILTFISFTTIPKSYVGIKHGVNDFMPAMLICIVYAMWLGGRPIS